MNVEVSLNSRLILLPISAGGINRYMELTSLAVNFFINWLAPSERLRLPMLDIKKPTDKGAGMAIK